MQLLTVRISEVLSSPLMYFAMVTSPLRISPWLPHHGYLTSSSLAYKAEIIRKLECVRELPLSSPGHKVHQRRLIVSRAEILELQNRWTYTQHCRYKGDLRISPVWLLNFGLELFYVTFDRSTWER